MKSLAIFLFTCCLSLTSNSQTYFEDQQFGIKIQEPSSWIIASNALIKENLKNVKLTEDQLGKLLDDSKGLISIRAYYKYDPDTVSGLIPTIKISARSNTAKTFDEFKMIMLTAANNLKSFVSNFQYIDTLTKMNISNRDCLYYSCQYTIKSKDGSDLSVRTKYYMIPKGKYFLSFSFMDNQADQDCSNLYGLLIKSLEVKE